MPILTTTIGAYPKPDYVKVPDWFNLKDAMVTSAPTREYHEAVSKLGDEAEPMFARGTQEAVMDQVNAGIDIPTDGEIRRENYIHYHCRHLDGFDFTNLTEKVLREGAYKAALPTIVSPIKTREHFLTHDWKVAQAFTDKPVKITLPGPLTTSDTTYDDYYHDSKALGAALANALNYEILALADAGARHIQVDEPLFARKPQEALDYGIENLERCFHGVPKHVTRTVHACCGYPNKIDDEEYPKAPQDSYLKIADAMNDAAIDALSLEDAHRHNDLKLLERFTRTKVIFGVVAIARSKVEYVDEIVERLKAALHHIDADRLIAAPDCGLGFLGRELAVKKLERLCEAAKLVG